MYTTTNESIFTLLVLVFSSLLIHVGDSRASRDLGEEDPGKDGYYDETTPADWVDILFIIVIAAHHFEYAFKFTDYSLAHIHLKEQKVTVDKDEKDLANMDIDSLRKLATSAFNGEPDNEGLKQEVGFEIFTTQSDGTPMRHMHNRVCCCITWAPRFFTWERTYVIRSFLKLYVCVACLLAMVLYVEFFMNLFVEYLITCIVHYDEYYVFALVMVPILLFVCDILIRLAWQAVVVSWSLNCDTNGDLEAMDAQVGIYALRSRLVSSKRLLYTFTSDARDNAEFDIYNEEQEELYRDRMEEEAQLKAANQRTKSYKDFKLDDLEEHQRNTIELTTKSDGETDEKGNESDFAEKAKEVLADAADAVKCTAEDVGDAIQEAASDLAVSLKGIVSVLDEDELTAAQKKEQYISQIQKAADKQRYRQKMGDFFMATCWRLGFFFYTMIFACLAAWSVEVEVAVNGFFWQLVMRYCVLGGIIWSMMYSVTAFVVAVASRYTSWYLIHQNIPRWKLFFLIDAHDYETNNRGWTRMKFLIMAGCLLAFVVMVVASWYFIDEKWSSFIHFLGIIFALYYFINLFMACKPYALVALWTDTIPPPGRNFTAHQIASETLRDQGVLPNSLRSVRNVTPDVDEEDEDDDSASLNAEADKLGATIALTPASATTMITLTPASTTASASGASPPADSYASVKTSSPATPAEIPKKALKDPVKSSSLNEKDAAQLKNGDSGKRDRADTLKAMSKKKHYKSFRTQRAEDLERRYAAFTYDYKQTNREAFDESGKKVICMDPHYMKSLGTAFLFNYNQYWLNIYRPFDEYDIESNLSSTHILAGFQWLKGICKCSLRCGRRRGRQRTCLQKCYTVAKYMMDNFCNICVVLTTIAFMYALFTTSQRLSGNNEAFRERVIYETNNTAYYGICSDKFGSGARTDSEYQLSVLDITVLTQLTYEADNYDLCGLIDVWFNGTFELVKIHRSEPFYFHMRHKHAAIDIIAIRGTDNVIEMMQDLSLFVEVTIFEGLQWVVPFLNGLPISFIRQILYYASYIEGVINADSRTAFDEPVYDYAMQYLRRLESDCIHESDTISNWHGPTTLYFVGHSLGGAIAEIVAANLHEENKKVGIKSSMQSFGVCSPGVLLSSAKFGFGVEALDKTASSLLPRRDLVSNVDFHGGSIQYTECDAGNMLQCHVMDNVLCELFHGCPPDLADDNRKKWLAHFCATSSKDDDEDKPQIGKSILHFDDEIIEYIDDWTFAEVVEQCDNIVYEECEDSNVPFFNCSMVISGSDDICFSEATLKGGHDD